jgi:hypothetical protein
MQGSAAALALTHLIKSTDRYSVTTNLRGVITILLLQLKPKRQHQHKRTEGKKKKKAKSKAKSKNKNNKSHEVFDSPKTKGAVLSPISTESLHATA